MLMALALSPRIFCSIVCLENAGNARVEIAPISSHFFHLHSTAPSQYLLCLVLYTYILLYGCWKWCFISWLLVMWSNTILLRWYGYKRQGLLVKSQAQAILDVLVQRIHIV